MKVLVVIISLSLYSSTLAALVEEKLQWLEFKRQHERNYGSFQEEEYRFSIFQENLKTITKHNALYDAGKTTYQMGINKFADWSRDEYLKLLNRQRVSRPELSSVSIPHQTLNEEIPKSKDWRELGAVSKVKDQGNCGSCWAFSVTGTLESFYFLKNNEMLSLSEQQLVDCDTSNTGCLGGEEAPALEYIKNNGIQSEESYPYEEETLTCRYNQTAANIRVAGYVKIPVGDEDALLEAVGLLGPVSVALDALELNFYQGGVFTSTTCSQNYTDHAVLAVGYGFDEETGLDYWLIKNSWGEAWGDEGYFKIKRGVNECAIAIDNVYPVL